MSQLLYGSVGFHGKIREQAVTYIDENRSTFQDAVVAIATAGPERGKGMWTNKNDDGMSKDEIDSEQEFDRYIKNMRINRT